MILIDIPGRAPLEIEHVLLDYNGSIAADGILSPETARLVSELSQRARVCVLTADTYGTVEEQCAGLGVEVLSFPRQGAARFKEDCAKGLQGGVACVGNGRNDIGMFDQAALSIAVVDAEGACAALLAHADIAVGSCNEALSLLLHADRIGATLCP